MSSDSPAAADKFTTPKGIFHKKEELSAKQIGRLQNLFDKIKGGAFGQPPFIFEGGECLRLILRPGERFVRSQI